LRAVDLRDAERTGKRAWLGRCTALRARAFWCATEERMDRTTTRVRVIVLCAVALALSGCFERTLRPVAPCTRSRAGDSIQVNTVDEVDLLFMIDNSGSMSEEQASLTAELPRLVEILASGDRNDDGVREFQPVRSLHIGIVSSDMGSGGFDIETCDRGARGAALGDDGVLITSVAGGGSGTCSATYPSVFEFERDRDDPAAFAADVACVARLGTSGCGFEQQLEAVLKALSPSTTQEWTVDGYTPPLFLGSSFGHADGANDGFIRPESALAVILVTDEEDCSVADVGIFDRSSPTYSGDLNLRCFMHTAAQHVIDRYVRGVDGRSGLMGLRRNPSLLIFAGIVGVPVDLVDEPDELRPIDFDGILADPRMEERIDPGMPTRLIPSCDVPLRGVAYPPRRIVRTAQALAQAGASVTIQSICQETYTSALDEIISKIAAAIGGACLPRALNPDADGFVDCDVYEVLPATGPTTHCAGLPGRDPDSVEMVEIDGVVRERCEVVQVGPEGHAADAPGWFYETMANADPDSDLAMLCADTPQRIRFTGGIDPTTNADIQLECVQTVRPGTGTEVSLGAFCDPEADVCGGGLAPDRATALTCDAADRTCGVACDSTATCTAAGLLGDVCDHRSWLEAVGATEQGISDAERARRMMGIPAGVAPEAAHGFCVSPTCI
jgi:hypothetical protein